ncbi:LuxE/PaaK family acyltransferase [Aquimarina agarilytica]|uniref:LuxE/PaaK family acyltransferase n=1 Tax=Aquimarina agarilytica TaxID=1087449 RepID=UPI0002884881|nr:acyltransferase [Aquimarina agarilytica]
MINTSSIFSIQTPTAFKNVCLEVFKYQYEHTIVYQRFCNLLGVSKKSVKELSQIPYLPIEFFKKQKVLVGNAEAQLVFSSSGTTGQQTSKHYVPDIKLYQESYLKGFYFFYNNIEDYCVLALLPAYLERKGSSLVYMVNDLIQKSKHPQSGFYLNDLKALVNTLKVLESKKQKTLLIGVSFALLDLAEQFSLKLKYTTVMETGGMKGRRKEMIRQELHQQLQNGLGVNEIHSEYGMTELLSQAYSMGNGVFTCPPWMRITTRNTENPLEPVPFGKTGGINVIDLANVHSCSFIATQDLGKIFENQSFEILGRFDHSDIRGCNLMVF